MRRLAIVLCLLALPAPVLGAPRTWSLKAGQALFWTGPHVEGSSEGESWTYRIRVEESAFRLRIGIDHPEIGDLYGVRVTDPDGETRSFHSGEGLYSAEALFERPAVGLWQIEVTADRVDDSNFRLRTKLEGRAPSLGTKAGPVLPNLQVLPPHEASFFMPVTNGAAASDPVGVDLAGAESCHPEEHAEDQAVRCLRFAFGVRSISSTPGRPSRTTS
jgi:hypothetical protein